MKIKKMYEPFRIGNCEIPNRFAVPAIVCDMCDENGYATEQYIRYHEEKAKGGFGLIITEDYAVNANAGGFLRVARIYKEDMIPGHKKLVDTVHKYGTKIFCQIYHAGRQTNHSVNGGVQPTAVSASPCAWNRETSREITVEEIEQIVKDFGTTAKNAKAAGFDGIEIHAGHGYFLAGFLSLAQNKRTDRYGGCFENRIRVLKEVYDEVRSNVGSDYPIMVRYSADEFIFDGRTLKESEMLAMELESWGVNAINCSSGTYGSFNRGIVSVAYEPHAFTSDNAKALKALVNIPIMAVNSIDDPVMAEHLVRTGVCDFVGMARSSLADPAMPNKAKAGRFDEIYPCVRCIQGCITYTVLQEPIRCCVNPVLGNEYKYNFSDTVPSKKVLIIGGGPAGLNAAIAAKKRGHDVTLWDKNSKLGGELLVAMCPPGKGEFSTYVGALTKEVENLGVNVTLNKEAAADEILAFGADKVILATGAVPTRPEIPGIHGANVVDARDVLLGDEMPEGRIIVAGGNEVAIETAMYLADRERGDIKIVLRGDKIGKSVHACRIGYMRKFLDERYVEIVNHTQIKEITADGVIAEENGKEITIPCEAVVTALGYHPKNDLVAKLQSLGDRLVTVGDVNACRDAMDAASEGYEAGYNA